MRALIVDPTAEAGLRLGETADPEPAPGQILVRNRHLAINFGDLNGAKRREAGFVPGWDSAGIVERAASDGSGPIAGTLVVATMSTQGGWAELRAVDVDELAPIPGGIDVAEASTLPVAGVTALRALRRCGTLLGRRVLVTSAAGGVGRFAVQLAHLAGAYVIASVGSTARGEGLHDLGADEVIVGLDGLSEPVHVVLDNVGGAQLTTIWANHLAEGAVVQCIGNTSQEAATFPSLSGMQRSLNAFTKGPHSGADIGVLMDLMRDGHLRVDVGWRGSWDRIAEASAALFGRQVAGKAVLDVD